MCLLSCFHMIVDYLPACLSVCTSPKVVSHMCTSSSHFFVSTVVKYPKYYNALLQFVRLSTMEKEMYVMQKYVRMYYVQLLSASQFHLVIKTEKYEVGYRTDESYTHRGCQGENYRKRQRV